MYQTLIRPAEHNGMCQRACVWNSGTSGEKVIFVLKPNIAQPDSTFLLSPSRGTQTDAATEGPVPARVQSMWKSYWQRAPLLGSPRQTCIGTETDDGIGGHLDQDNCLLLTRQSRCELILM